MKYRSVGQKIKQARLEKKMTQKELGSKLGLTWEMISRYERGRSNPLIRIMDFAKALNKPVSYFLQDSHTSTTYSTYDQEKSSPNLDFVKEPTSQYYLSNYIPLIQNPKDLKSRNTLFYPAPDWILKNFPNSIALWAANCIIKTPKIQALGIIYLNAKAKTELKAVLSKEKITILEDDKDTSQERIGAVIAWEKRFV